MKEFEALRLLQAKVDGIEAIQARLDGLDVKFEEQVQRLDQVQSKVNLSVSSIGEIHQEQVQVAHHLKQSSTAREADLNRLAEPGCLAASPTTSQSGGRPFSTHAQPPPPPPPPPPLLPLRDHASHQQQVLNSPRPLDEQQKQAAMDAENGVSKIRGRGSPYLVG